MYLYKKMSIVPLNCLVQSLALKLLLKAQMKNSANSKLKHTETTISSCMVNTLQRTQFSFRKYVSKKLWCVLKELGGLTKSLLGLEMR